jgi:hypothetical protein
MTNSISLPPFRDVAETLPMLIVALIRTAE